MPDRETSEVDVEFITGVIGRQAHVLLEGDAGTLLLEGITVGINGVVSVNGMPLGGAGPGATTQQEDQALGAAAADTELIFAMLANRGYSFAARIKLAAVSNTSVVTFNLAFPAGMTGAYWIRNAWVNTGAQVIGILGDQTSSLSTSAADAGGTGFVVLEGHVLNAGVAGNMRIQALRGGAAGTVKKGSSITYSPASA